MRMTGLHTHMIDWKEIVAIQHEGETGYSLEKVKSFGAVRVRIVEYSPHFTSDHWCTKGHILFCISGTMKVELNEGREVFLHEGTSCVLEENSVSHRVQSEEGAILFIVD